MLEKIMKNISRVEHRSYYISQRVKGRAQRMDRVLNDEDSSWAKRERFVSQGLFLGAYDSICRQVPMENLRAKQREKQLGFSRKIPPVSCVGVVAQLNVDFLVSVRERYHYTKLSFPIPIM